MKKIITKKTMVLASILLITAVIGTQAFAQMGRGRNNMRNNTRAGYGNHMGNGYMMGGGYMMGNGCMMNNLSVEDQQKMLDQMNKFFNSTKTLRGEIYQTRLELNQEIAKKDVDETKVADLQKELIDLFAKFNKARYDHMSAMQKLNINNNGTDNFMGMRRGMGRGYNRCFN